jgi:hypothetical protein
MESPKESLEKKNIFAEKYDEIRRLDGKHFVIFPTENTAAQSLHFQHFMWTEVVNSRHL